MGTKRDLLVSFKVSKTEQETISAYSEGTHLEIGDAIRSFILPKMGKINREKYNHIDM